MGLKQKTVFNAGVKSTISIPDTSKYLDMTNIETKTPKSKYSIVETSNFPFTNKIVGFNTKNLNIADGERRPGTKWELVYLRP